jgi:hypothetical protein
LVLVILRFVLLLILYEELKRVYNFGSFLFFFLKQSGSKAAAKRQQSGSKAAAKRQQSGSKAAAKRQQKMQYRRTSSGTNLLYRPTFVAGYFTLSKPDSYYYYFRLLQ